MVMVPATEPIRILIACGTAIATATLVASKLKEVFKELGIPITVVQCKAAEVSGKITVFQPHVIVATITCG
jgi:PTS system galactitol-specific IIB component